LAGSKSPEALLESTHGILTNPAATEQLAEAAFLFRDTPIGQDALLQLARQQLATNQQQKAIDSLQQILSSQIIFPWRSEAATLLDRFSLGAWLQTDAVGALLPLTGTYQTFGKLVQRGIEMALALHNAEKPALRVIYRDTAAEPANARLAVTSLINEDRVMAILGPLTSAAALAAAAEAERHATPILTLTQRSNIADIGPYVFRNSLTARLQARELARYAITRRGYSSFAILAPETPPGRIMAELFSDEVLKLGGLVTFEQTYPEDATDFREQILRLMGKSPQRQRENYQPRTEAQKLDDLFIPDEPDYPSTTFDALFIPDYAERIGQIAPQLAFYGIDDLPLLGFNGWNSPELLRLAGRYVEGAVFVDGFFLESSQPIVQEFIRLYRETYSEDPTILEAQAFDAANILFSLLDRKDLDSREALRNALARLRNYPGVTGNTSFDFTGEANKNLFLLKVQEGRIVQLP
jgi:ABC-type branched-subunit amino acid transport system substrate-binding protein